MLNSAKSSKIKLKIRQHCAKANKNGVNFAKSVHISELIEKNWQNSLYESWNYQKSSADKIKN